jgi:hypothetical protein
MALLNCYLLPIIFNSNVFEIESVIIDEKMNNLSIFLEINQIVKNYDSKIFLHDMIIQFICKPVITFINVNSDKHVRNLNNNEIYQIKLNNLCLMI